MTSKIAVITGISKGIGAAIALQLAEDGYTVHGNYNTDEAGAKEIQSKFPTKIHIHQADFSDRQSTLKFCRLFENMTVDAVVNNAGVVFFENFDEFDFRQWDKTLEVNLTTPLVISQFFYSRMNSKGALVNVASTDGMTGTFSTLAYAASKAGLISLTKALGNLYGKKGLRANAVAPGWINTGMSTAASLAAKDLTPIGRNGIPKDVADVVAFLLSENAAYINGATLIIDGGYTNVDTIMMREAKGEL